MNEIGSIIKKWRYKNNLTGAELAKKIEVSQQFLNEVENGKKKLSKKVFEKIVLVVDFETKNELEYTFYVNELPSNLKEKLEGKIKVGNIDLNNPITKFKEIPVYDSISAGKGSCKSGIVGYIPLPETNGFKGEVIGIKVAGDSMQPDIKNGDTVLIKKEIMPENGEVGAFILNDEGLLKRYKKTDRGDIILSSDNKDYDPIIINESDEFYIVGKKVGVFNH